MAKKVLKLDGEEITKAINFYISNFHSDFLPDGTKTITKLVCENNIFAAYVEENKDKG